VAIFVKLDVRMLGQVVLVDAVEMRELTSMPIWSLFVSEYSRF
jgi:hypothetical protein